MVEATILAALAFDAAIGWPQGLYARVGHPVGLFARLIDRADWRWNRLTRPPAARRAAGVLTLILLLALGGGAGWAIQQAAYAFTGRWAWLVVALAAWPALAQRSLFHHVRAVSAPLARGDLPTARRKVAQIVGRDTEALDEAGVARAAIESLAESFCDGVIAPLFWLFLLGLPGIWAYKAVNTADSLIGHREDRWRAFGWASARADDIANYLPARLAGLLLCLAAPGGWRTMTRDHAVHASPNSGWPEAAIAGALGVSLGGAISYDGAVAPRGRINAPGRTPRAEDLARALRIYVCACLLGWLIAGGISWVR